MLKVDIKERIDAYIVDIEDRTDAYSGYRG